MNIGGTMKMIAWGKRFEGKESIYTEDMHFKVQSAYIEDEAKRLQDEYKKEQLLIKLAAEKLRLALIEHNRRGE